MKKSLTLFIMVFLLLAEKSFTQDYQDWKYVNPTPQSNLLRKLKMLSENEWVTVGANGLFMHTSNSGANWYFHNFCGRVNAALSAGGNPDLWFFNSNNGIVIGDQAYIGRTSNGGVTFDSINTVSTGLLTLAQRCQSIWFADANVGYIGAGAQTGGFSGRVLKTTDGGATWAVVYSVSGSYITSLGGGDAQTVCAALADGTCISTTDGGSNWTTVPSSFPPVTSMNSIAFANSTTGFAAGSGGSFLRTTNGGLNWQNLGTPQVIFSYFQVKVVSINEIYVIGDPGFLYKSTDQGSTWSTLPIAVTGPAITFLWYSMDVFGSKFVMSGDYGVTPVSTDGAVTWSSNSVNFGSQLLSDITSVPGTSKIWAVGRAGNQSASSGQILYSSNTGSTWSSRNLGIAADLQAISMINENIGYASGTNNTVAKTTDGGVTWTPKTGPTPIATSQIYSLEFVTENIGFAFVNFNTVPGGNVFKTTNGGDSWTQYQQLGAFESIYSADMVDENIGYFTHNSSGRPVYKTSNGGVNWSPLTTGLTGSIRSVSASDANTVYVCQTGGTSRVAKSTNGGATWTGLTNLPAVDFTSIKCINANTVYVCGNSTAVVCKTTDGGATWTFQNTHNITLIKVYATQGDTALTIGGNQSILRNAGANKFPSVNLTVLFEGFYNENTDRMSMSDTATVYLRNNFAPYAIRDSAKGTIDSLTFSGQFSFSNATSGTYYIVVRQRNTIETWSKPGGETIKSENPNFSYDFTTASNKAFGNNQTQKGSKWCIYSGDVNQDGVVDAIDISACDNDAFNFVTGYVPTDVNGDLVTDSPDLTIIDNNAFNFVAKIRP